jgi:hypothetical protein
MEYRKQIMFAWRAIRIYSRVVLLPPPRIEIAGNLKLLLVLFPLKELLEYEGNREWIH